MTAMNLSLILNGAPHRAAPGTTIAALLGELALDPTKVAVERNLEIVPRSTFGGQQLADGDRLEIVHFVGGGQGDSWTVAGRTFRSRLIVGTGKYKDFAQNAAALEASGAEIVTVAVRRVNVTDKGAPLLTDYHRPQTLHLSAQHGGLFHRRRCGPHAAIGARGWRLEPRQTRSAGGGADALSRHGRNAASDRRAGQGRLRRHGLLRRRPHRCEEARRLGRLRDHAFGVADRLGPRHPEPRHHPHDRRGGQGAGTRRRGCRHPRPTRRRRWNWAAPVC